MLADSKQHEMLEFTALDSELSECSPILSGKEEILKSFPASLTLENLIQEYRIHSPKVNSENFEKSNKKFDEAVISTNSENVSFTSLENSYVPPQNFNDEYVNEREEANNILKIMRSAGFLSRLKKLIIEKRTKALQNCRDGSFIECQIPATNSMTFSSEFLNEKSNLDNRQFYVEHNNFGAQTFLSNSNIQSNVQFISDDNSQFLNCSSETPANKRFLTEESIIGNNEFLNVPEVNSSERYTSNESFLSCEIQNSSDFSLENCPHKNLNANSCSDNQTQYIANIQGNSCLLDDGQDELLDRLISCEDTSVGFVNNTDQSFETFNVLNNISTNVTAAEGICNKLAILSEYAENEMIASNTKIMESYSEDHSNTPVENGNAYVLGNTTENHKKLYESHTDSFQTEMFMHDHSYGCQAEDDTVPFSSHIDSHSVVINNSLKNLKTGPNILENSHNDDTILLTDEHAIFGSKKDLKSDTGVAYDSIPVQILENNDVLMKQTNIIDDNLSSNLDVVTTTDLTFPQEISLSPIMYQPREDKLPKIQGADQQSYNTEINTENSSADTNPLCEKIVDTDCVQNSDKNSVEETPLKSDSKTSKHSLKGLQKKKLHSLEKPQTPEFTCDLCNKKCISKELLKNHKLTHVENRPHSCDICGKCFKHNFEVTAHKRCHNKPTFKCDICSKMFIHKSHLTVHRKNHLNEFEFFCKECDKGFVSKSLYKNHVNVEHLKMFHVCDQCGAQIKSLSALKEHKLTHDPSRKQRSFVCETCGKDYLTIRNLRAHIKTHTEIKYLCNICGKKLSGKSVLETHLKMHSGEKNLFCKHCNKAFSSKEYLTRHERSHSGVKPYQCEHCNKCFTQRGTLKAHLRIHSGEKPFKCHCGKSFRTKTHLVVHYKSHNKCD